ncbi:MAG TPA: hypothetical protein VHZ78_08950 [Rhizomicrobium sp.]|jgi:hypothetical protein|nr:hypothetical protein [Rhizomicrobium sp.]
MGEEGGFFRFVWRFNAVLIALVGILGFGLTIFGGLQLFGGERPLPVQATADDEVQYNLEPAIQPLTGTGEVLFTLKRSRGGLRGGGGSYSSGRAEQDANYLVVRGDTAAGVWLFAHSGQVIWSQTDIQKTVPATGPGGDTVAAVVMTVADDDTDKDGVFTTQDRQSLYVYRVGGGPAEKFFSADNISHVAQIDSARLLVIFTDKGVLGAATFSISDFKLLSRSALPPAPK